jgi:hypothetical protein
MTEAQDPDQAGSTSALDLVLVMCDWVLDPDVVTDATARDLHRLVSHDVATPTTPQLRIGHLGLLIDLINDCRHYVPEQVYTDVRAERAASGQVWPAGSTLRTLYGPWELIIDEVSDFVQRGPASKLNRPGVRPKPKKSYTPTEVMSALHRCRHELGIWPSPWTYELWAQIERRLARNDPRLPTIKAIAKTFGDWSAAARAAEAAWRKHRLRLVTDEQRARGRW